MTRGINQIDLHPFVFNRNVLRKDRNPSLAFQIIAVKNSLSLQLRFTVLTALLQQAIHHGGFAVVNVSDDDNVTNIVATHWTEFSG